LTRNSWERRHELIFALEFKRAECEFLSSQLSVAEERFVALSNRAATSPLPVRIRRREKGQSLDRNDTWFQNHSEDVELDKQ